MKRIGKILVLMMSSLLILGGCSERVASTNQQDIQKLGYPSAVIETSAGTMELELWNDVAPETVKNFTKLANEKFMTRRLSIELLMDS